METWGQEKKERRHLLLIRGLERFSYWGLLSILTLYLVLEEFVHFQDEVAQDKAYEIRRLLKTSIIFTPLLGGILGDIFRKEKGMILIGAALCVIGSMGIWWGSGPNIIKAFIITIAVGFGMITPTIKASFGRSFSSSEVSMDSNWVVFSLVGDLGAALGPILIGLFAETYGSGYAFILLSLTMMGATIPMLWKGTEDGGSGKVESAPYEWNKKNVLTSIVAFLGLLMVIDVLFSATDKGIGFLEGISSIKNAVNNVFGDEIGTKELSLWAGSGASILFLIPMVFLWKRYRTSTFWKIGTSLLILGIGGGLYVFLLHSGSGALGIFLALLVLVSLSRAFFDPLWLSLVAQRMPKRWLGTIIGGFPVLMWSIYSLASFFMTKDMASSPIIYCAVALGALIVGGLVLFMAEREKSSLSHS